MTRCASFTLAFALQLRKSKEKPSHGGTIRCVLGHLAGNQEELPVLISPYCGTQVDTWSTQMSAKLLN